MTRYERAPGIVWRVGPDRVLVRKVGQGADGALDLLGPAAVAWVALDEPATVDELAERLTEAEVPGERVDEAVQQLVESGLVVTEPVP